jgi:hypothetical protein
MPDLSNADRKDLTILGLVLSGYLPYTEGHTLTAMEAGVLSQTFQENIRNNYAPKLRKLCEENKVEKVMELPQDVLGGIQKDFDSYVEGYEFGVRGGREADPVKARAIAFAVEAVKTALKSKGHKLSEVGSEAIRARAIQAVDDNPAFLQKAEAVIKAEREAASDLSVEL